jgi:hypothetical protein
MAVDRGHLSKTATVRQYGVMASSTGRVVKIGAVVAGVILIVAGLVLALVGVMAMGAPSVSNAVILIGIVMTSFGVWLLAVQVRHSS